MVTGEGDPLDDLSTGDSITDQFIFFEQYENMAESGQRESHSYTATNQSNSNSSYVHVGMNFNLNNDTTNPQSGCLSFVRLLEGENMENIQWQVENPQSDSTFARPYRSEGHTTEALMEVPTTRGQRRARSRSPETQTVRAGIGNSSPPNSLNEMLWTADYVENIQSEVEIPQSESTEGSTTEALMDVPLTRGQRRGRSRSPETRRVRERSESNSPPNPVRELIWRFRDMPPEIFEELMVSEVEIFPRFQQHETVREQLTRPVLQSRNLYAGSPTRNTFSVEPSSYITSNYQSGGLSPRHPGVVPDLQITLITETEHSPRDRTANRGSQLTSESPNNTVTLQSDQQEGRTMFPHSEEASETTSARLHVSTISDMNVNDTTSVATQGILRHMTGFGESSNHIESDNESNDSDSSSNSGSHTSDSSSDSNSDSDDSNNDLEPNDSFSSQNMGGEESQNRRDSSDDISIVSSTSNPSYISLSDSPIIFSSSVNNTNSSSSGPLPTSNSANDNLETGFVMTEDSIQTISSSDSPPEGRQESRSTTPATSDESDSLPFIDQFFHLNEGDHNQPTGLTKQQIDNLAVRDFDANDAPKTCTICVAEYTEGNKIRILPCSHEYHVHCIDRWLFENSTCPICRRQVANSGDRKF
jgi:E3 ubiquitin-protein ligase RLIM